MTPLGNFSQSSLCLWKEFFWLCGPPSISSCVAVVVLCVLLKIFRVVNLFFESVKRVISNLSFCLIFFLFDVSSIVKSSSLSYPFISLMHLHPVLVFFEFILYYIVSIGLPFSLYGQKLIIYSYAWLSYISLYIK